MALKNWVEVGNSCISEGAGALVSRVGPKSAPGRMNELHISMAMQIIIICPFSVLQWGISLILKTVSDLTLFLVPLLVS